jgi:hypothetical protein
MVICGVVASEFLLTYDPVRSEGIPCSALHLAIPEQAPIPEYSADFEAPLRRDFNIDMTEIGSSYGDETGEIRGAWDRITDSHGSWSEGHLGP